MINAYDYTLKKLIAGKDYLFHVPNYQRSYVWTDKEILQFVRDGYFCMQKYNGRGDKFDHYAGQMIFRSIKKEHDGKERLEIIDGQQRLTTLEILVLAVIDILKLLEENLEVVESLKSTYLVSMPLTGNTEKEMVLCLSKKDQGFWHDMIEGAFSDKEEVTLKLESQRRIWNAYKIIKKFFFSQIKDLSGEEQRDKLLDYVEALVESFRVIVLVAENPGHEFALFQIVNDRGIPLTPGELLKARTMELLTSQSKELRRERLARTAEEIWEDILSDSGAVTEKYLIWNYIAMLGKGMENIKKIPINVYYEKDIFQCIDMREVSLDMQDRILEQLETLRDNIHICRELEEGKFPVRGASTNLNLYLGILIRNMRNRFCIPLYLRILAVNREKNALDIAEKLTPMLTKTYFIAKVVGNVNDESIMNCYLKIWEKLGQTDSVIPKITACLEKLMEKDKCKIEFYTKLNQPVYDRGASNIRAKFLLLIAELQYLKECGDGSSCCSDDSVEIIFDKLSVEHILCESVNENAVSKDFYESVHKLGNLTLLGKKLNSKERAKRFEEKRRHYRASPYYITREVGELESWMYHDFKNRQETIVNMLKRAFEI